MKPENRNATVKVTPVFNEAGDKIGEVVGRLPSVKSPWVSADGLVSGVVSESSEKEVVVIVIAAVVKAQTPTSGAPAAPAAPPAPAKPEPEAAPKKGETFKFISKFDLRDPFQDKPKGRWFKAGEETTSELTPWVRSQVAAKFFTQLPAQ